MSEHYQETKWGFEWGSAEILRGFSSHKEPGTKDSGWVTFLLRTPKHKHGIQLYVTKSGKVRVLMMTGLSGNVVKIRR